MSRRDRSGRDATVVVLAVGLVVAVNCLTIAALYDAIVSSQSGLSENATQILTTAFGGIIGVLGSVLGYKVGSQDTTSERQTTVSETPAAAQPQSEADAVRPSGKPEQPQDIVGDDDTSAEIASEPAVVRQDDAEAPEAG